jgi:hypothetical protein
MTVTAYGRIRQRLLLGSLTGVSAILVIACSPSGGMPGMRPALTPAPLAAGHTVSVSPVTEVSGGCAGQNAEVETATAAPDYVYDVWIGCRGIGFARSADGGLHFGTPMTVPGSRGTSRSPRCCPPSRATGATGTSSP